MFEKGYAFILIVVFLSPFLIAIGAIVYIGSVNESKIENLLAQKQCEHVYNYKGRFKALCNDEIVLIHDYFLVDFDTNEKISYKSIRNIQENGNEMVISHDTIKSTLSFESLLDRKIFQEALEQRRKK